MTAPSQPTNYWTARAARAVCKRPDDFEPPDHWHAVRFSFPVRWRCNRHAVEGTRAQACRGCIED